MKEQEKPQTPDGKKKPPAVFTNNLPAIKQQAAGSNLLAKKAVGGFGLSTDVKLGDLLDAKKAIDIYTTVAKELGVRKITTNILTLVFNIPPPTVEFGKLSISPEMEDVCDVIARSIENAETQDERMELYEMLDAGLKGQLCVPTIEDPNILLWEQVDGDPHKLRRYFLKKISYIKPKENRTSISWAQLDEYVSEQVANMLSRMRVEDAKEWLLELNPKIMYLFVTSEIKNYIGNNDRDGIMEIRCALDYHDIMPPSCHLLSFMQQYAHEFYAKAIADIKNGEHQELYEMFNEELDNRDMKVKAEEKKMWERYKTDDELPTSDIEDLIDFMDSPEDKGV